MTLIKTQNIPLSDAQNFLFLEAKIIIAKLNNKYKLQYRELNWRLNKVVKYLF